MMLQVNEKKKKNQRIPSQKSRRLQCQQNFERVLFFFCLLVLVVPPQPYITSSVVVAQSTCSINGEIFEEGENVGDAIELRCPGSYQEWPCFCDPNLPSELNCPYCGFATGDGTLYCARDMETITFQDGSINRICSCEIPSDPSQPSIRSCTIETETSPVSAPSEAPGGGGTCIFPNFDGDLVIFQDGESFGNLIEGICGSYENWPSFCSAPPDGDGNDFFIEYPYCVFDDAAPADNDGGIVCANDGEDVVYEDINGNTLTCTCAYSDGLQATNCTMGGEIAPVTVAPVAEPTPTLAPQPAPPPTTPAPQPPQTEETPSPTNSTNEVPTEPKGGDSGAIQITFHLVLLLHVSLILALIK